MSDLDQELFQWVNSFVGTMAWVDSAMVFLASDFVLPMMIAAATWSLWFLGKSQSQRLSNQLGFIYAAGGAGLANWAIAVLNQYFYRPRPFVSLEDVTMLLYRPTDSSFPSNAAAFAFAMGTGVFLVHRALGTAILVGAVILTSARVYVGIHYPMDILGGAVAGALCVAVMFRACSIFHPVVSFAFRVARALYLA